MLIEGKVLKLDLSFTVALLSIILLPFWKLGNLILTILLITIFARKLFFDKQNIKILFFMPLLLFISLLFMYKSVFLTNINYLEKIGLLTVVPIGFIFFDKRKKYILKIIFSLSVFVAQIYSVFHIIYYFFSNNIIFNGLTNYRYINGAIGFERPYIAFMSSISILSLLFTKTLRKRYDTGRKFILGFGFLYIIFISGKLALILSTLFFTTYLIINKKWRIMIGFLLTAVIIISSFNLSITQRIKEIKKDDRIYLWENVLTLVDKNHNVFLGATDKGFKEIESSFTEINVKNTADDELKRYYKKTKKNIHNQFLSLYICCGILAVIFFISPLLYFLLCSVRERNIYNSLVIISFLFFLMVENLLERQTGVLLLGTFLGIIASFETKQKDENNFI